MLELSNDIDALNKTFCVVCLLTYFTYESLFCVFPFFTMSASVHICGHVINNYEAHPIRIIIHDT